MAACNEIVSAVLADEKNDWSCRSVDASTMHLVSPRYYADGDAVELTVKQLGNELLVSDGGEAAARLEMNGINLDAAKVKETWRSLLRAHNVDYREGRVLARGQVGDASWLLRSMLDALVGLDGLRLLAPTPQEMRFSEKLTTFLRAEFPEVEEHPELRGASGTSYRLTASAGTTERMVYVQALAGSSLAAKQRAVEHAYTTFSDVNGSLPLSKKLVVGGEIGQWKPERLRLLTNVAYVGSWESRERFTQFILGDISKEKLLLGKGEQLTVPL